MSQSGNYLLDTNIIIGMFIGNPAIEEKIQSSNNLFLASPSVGELYYGAQKSDKIRENLHKIDIFVENHIFLPCDLETAQWYGIIKDQLRRKGHPIPDNDIWIASIAMQHRLILVTRDSHFDQVESLQTEYW
jgi:tRNA(fMet)-specific endonuclease VapC